MAIDAYREPKTTEDMEDDDDAPLVFKRSSLSAKQNQASAETKQSSSQKHEQLSGKPAPEARSQNGQTTVPQKGKTVPSNSPPIRSPLASPKPNDLSGKGISSDVNSKSTVMSNEPKSVKRQIKEKKPSITPTGESNEDPDDSEDEKPISARVKINEKKPLITHTGKSNEDSDDFEDEKLLSARWKINTNQSNKELKDTNMETVPKTEDSDDEKPLSLKFGVKNNGGASTSDPNGSASMERKHTPLIKKRPINSIKSESESPSKKPKHSNASNKVEKKEDDDEDHIPILRRMKKPTSDKKSSSIKSVTKPVSSISKTTSKKSKKFEKTSKYSKSSSVPPSSGEGQRWTTLVHHGVIFPPPYTPHKVKMLYKGKPVELTPEQEEVATMYAVMLDTDYMSKPKFRENFMEDWRMILGNNHIIQNLEDCDFTPIYEWHQKEKEKKKQMSTEEKKAIKEEKMKQEEKYMWAIVNGVKEKVGNFRVEPPGLFRGRGEHPKMGKLKRRIYPSDIVINIGKDAPVPECPIPGERWKEIRHDNTVTWLAFWNDPINPKEFKYVFLAASSTLKGQSDKEKYEKARLLKDYIHGIRATYTKDFTSKDLTKKQIAVATYLIDKLALRAGNEKDEEEADTVGCCTLKVENVETVPPNILKFDFLGKDSIRYQNEVEVETPVFKSIQQFRSGKRGSDDLFEELDTNKLNAHLKGLMPGLTAKVFRTYNASITLDNMAFDLEEHRYVACKLHGLNAHWSEDKKQSYIRHAIREYKIHKSLVHRHIVQLWDIFEIDDNTFCTVLEYCSGKDLDAVLKATPVLPEREAKIIIVQIFQGLVYLNKRSQKIIHYDLKPGNVLFDEFGVAKVTDFGLSKIVEDNVGSRGMELTSQGAGTYWYLPPECFELSQIPLISSKVDVWSAGILLYQMLFGKRPFGHDQSQERILREDTIIKARKVEFPSRPSVSNEAKDFIRRCLTYNQVDRPDVLSIVQDPFLNYAKK